MSEREDAYILVNVRLIKTDYNINVKTVRSLTVNDYVMNTRNVMLNIGRNIRKNVLYIIENINEKSMPMICTID